MSLSKISKNVFWDFGPLGVKKVELEGKLKHNVKAS
jgi:hypothetical protein